MDGFLDGSWTEQPGGRFLNRYDAGRGIAARFGDKIRAFKGKGVVVGLPRGGVEVAAAVANDLGLPLDFRSVRKVGHPMQPEFAIGAVDISGIAVRNPSVPSHEMPPEAEFNRLVERALDEARQFEVELRGKGKSPIDDAAWCFVVDDGAATGLTLLAAVKGLKGQGKTVYVAVPVSSDQARDLLTEAADGFYAMSVPSWFGAVGQFYYDFTPVSLDDVKGYLGIPREPRE